MHEPNPAASAVLPVYAQDLIDGRRVVVFGDATSGLADQLVERGARLVHVFDWDVTRVAEATARGASRNISYAPLSQSGLSVRDGAFDVGFVDNLAAASDRTQVMSRLRRALAARGACLIACPNPDALSLLLPREASDSAPSYYDFYDLVSAEFDEVKMLGQTPFVGFALADFAPDADSAFSIDTSYIPGGAEEPAWFVAMASHFPLESDPYCVVQLPAADTLASLSSSKRQPSQRTVSAVESDGSVQGDPDRAEAIRLLAEAKKEIGRRDAWVATLEERASAADERADAAEHRVSELNNQLQQAESTGQKSVAATKLDRRQADARAAAAAQLQSAEREIERLQGELEAARASERVRTKNLEVCTKNLEAATRQRSEALEALKDQQKRSESAEERAATLTQRLTTLDAALRRAEAASANIQARCDALEASVQHDRKQVGERRQETARLEHRLKERGGEVQRLERELVRSERFAAHLLALRDNLLAGSVNGGTTEDFGPQVLEPSEATSLRQQLIQLAELEAQRAADLSAARWRIEELENRQRTSVSSET